MCYVMESFVIKGKKSVCDGVNSEKCLCDGVICHKGYEKCVM